MSLRCRRVAGQGGAVHGSREQNSSNQVHLGTPVGEKMLTRMLRNLVAVLSQLWQPFWSLSLSRERLWREQIPMDRELWLSGLRETTKKTYRKALAAFWKHVRKKRWHLDLNSDVDLAAAAYVQGVTKTQAEATFAALERRYPPLKGELRWTRAVVGWKRAQSMPNHHKPLAWEIALGLAYALWLLGRPWTGALLLLQWRLGLRPSEALRLRAQT